MTNLICPMCGKEYDDMKQKICANCGSPLFFMYNSDKEKFRNCIDNAKHLFTNGVWSFHPLLPTRNIGISLGEGWTPLIKAKNLSEILGIELYIKNEALNPNSTFIDRGSVVDVQFAYENMFKSIVTASPGDYSVSVASYARVRGIESLHFVPRYIESWKIYRLILTNSSVIFSEDYGKAIDKAIKYSEQRNSYLSIPLSPTVIDGYRTLVFEIISIFRQNIDWISIPIGDGVLASAIYKGINEIAEIMGIDPPGIIMSKVEHISVENLFDEVSRVILSELDIEEPLASKFLRKILEIGIMVEINENDVFKAVYLLASEGGLFIDPVGVAGLAGVVNAVNNGIINRSEKVVVVLSGSPSKDPYILYKTISYNSDAKNIARDVIMRENVYMNEVRREILRILYEMNKLHMYGIWRELKRRGFTISLQTLYYHVNYLKNNGLIKIIGRNGRRILYALSEVGLDTLSKISS